MEIGEYSVVVVSISSKQLLGSFRVSATKEARGFLENDYVAPGLHLLLWVVIYPL